MKIAQIKQLELGMSGITTVGCVGYCGKPQHITGTNEKGDYDFWSQFVTLEDNTETIGTSFSVIQGQSLVKGEQIFVEKATLDSYQKDGKDILKLKVSKWRRGQAPQAPQQPRQAPKAPLPPPAPQINPQDATQTSIERQTAWRGACDRCAGMIINNSETSAYAVVELAQAGAYFISTGLNIFDKKEIDQQLKAAAEDGGDPQDEPPPDDNDIPF